MPPGKPSKRSPPQGGLAAVGVAAFVVACCAALPLLVAFAGSVAIAAVLGAGAGLVAGLLLVALVVARARRRRARRKPSWTGPSR
jgi:Flp pilus assembly protein TadB